MNAPMVIEQKHLPMTAADVRAHVNLIQEVMQSVMKDGTHFGKIPGTPKPSLWKAGAEKIAQTFHIAVSYRTDELPTPNGVRYRVTAIGTHQMSGVVMGEGVGECSSNEEKYKWRKANSAKEFDATPENMRRTKYGKDYETKQVRTEPADVANTILKMACKRAQVAMTLNVTAASDIFTQDIEDLPEELRPDDEGRQREQKKDAGPQPYPAEGFAKNLAIWRDLITSGKKTAEQIIAIVSSKGTLTDEQKAEIIGKPVNKATGETVSMLEQVKRICAVALTIADNDTAFLRLDDARILLPEMKPENKELAVKEIDAALAAIKARAF